jgi:hypothetical protein
MTDARCRTAVEVGERYADGRATPGELTEASEEAFCRRSDLKSHDAEAAAIAAAFAVVDPADRDPNLPPITTVWAVQGTSDDLLHFVQEAGMISGGRHQTEVAKKEAADAERAAQANVLRDVFGNPFRLVSADPAWRTPHVVKLAQAIYDEHRFQDLPVLADALEEAGCDRTEVLGHLRSPGPHVRGCYVVDLLLDKE